MIISFLNFLSTSALLFPLVLLFVQTCDHRQTNWWWWWWWQLLWWWLDMELWQKARLVVFHLKCKGLFEEKTSNQWYKIYILSLQVGVFQELLIWDVLVSFLGKKNKKDRVGCQELILRILINSYLEAHSLIFLLQLYY